MSRSALAALALVALASALMPPSSASAFSSRRHHRAQEEEPAPTSPTEEPTATSEAAFVEDARRSEERIGARPVASALLGLAFAGVPSLAIGAGFGLATDDGLLTGEQTFWLVTMLAAASAVVLLHPIGVWIAAKDPDDDDALGLAYLGSLAGGTVGAGLIAGGWALADELDDPGGATLRATSIVLGVGAAVCGPVIAMEMRQHARFRDRVPNAAPTVAWAPTFAVDATGATFGLFGTF